MRQLDHHVIGFAGDTSHTNYFMQSVWYHRPSSAHHSVLASHLDRNQRNPLTSPGETARRRRKFFEILIQKHLNSLRKIVFLNLKIEKIRLRRAIPRLPSVPDLSPAVLPRPLLQCRPRTKTCMSHVFPISLTTSARADATPGISVMRPKHLFFIQVFSPYI